MRELVKDKSRLEHILGGIDDAFGFGYVKALCENFYGIHELEYYKAEGLDLPDADIEGILQAVMRQMDGE